MLPILHTSDGTASLAWHLHPDVILFCVGLLVAYWYAITRLRARISDAGRVRRSQVVLFTLGVLSIYLASSSPVHEIAEQYLASVHMFQHLLYTMVAPPLLIAGTPAWLFRAPLRDPNVFRIARFLTYPLVAFAIFNTVQLLTHLPSAVDLSLQVHWLHFLVHASLLLSALLMWWPILSPLEELPRLSPPLQMAYLFVQSLIPTVLAAFLTFSEGSFYHYYQSAPRLWGLSAVEDQQFAGFVMKIIGSLILWGFIAYAFFKWYERENKQSVDPRWEEIQEELQRMGIHMDNPQPRK